jgi:hypothetical protein
MPIKIEAIKHLIDKNFSLIIANNKIKLLGVALLTVERP